MLKFFKINFTWLLHSLAPYIVHLEKPFLNPTPDGYLQQVWRLDTAEDTRRTASCHSASSFYGRSSKGSGSPEKAVWQPGQYLPVRHENPPPTDFHTLLAQMQTAITTQVQKIQTSVDMLFGRVDQLEDVSGTMEQVCLCQTLSSSGSPSSTESNGSGQGKSRKRRIAPNIYVSTYLEVLQSVVLYMRII